MTTTLVVIGRSQSSLGRSKFFFGRKMFHATQYLRTDPSRGHLMPNLDLSALRRKLTERENLLREILRLPGELALRELEPDGQAAVGREDLNAAACGSDRSVSQCSAPPPTAGAV